MAIGLLYPASSQCHDPEGFCCSISGGSVSSWLKLPFDSRKVDSSSVSFRLKSPSFGSMQSYWLSTWQDMPLSKVRVAADFPDFVPESSTYTAQEGYHPLEEIKGHHKVRDLQLTRAEIARTTLEANNKALLVFPGTVHKEPHRHVSWAELQYIIDEYGDIFFELLDDKNMLQDRGASNPVTVLIGRDYPISMYSSVVHSNNVHNVEVDNSIDMEIYYDSKDDDMEISDTPVNWGMLDTLRYIHPLYFSKSLTKAISTMGTKMMDHPSNGLCIVGCLRPAFADEISYLGGLLHYEDSEEYILDWRDESEKEEQQATGGFDLIDGQIFHINSRRNEVTSSSSVYKLEILTVELFSVYGDCTMVPVQDFQNADPDVLVHSGLAIIDRLSDYDAALRALCRRKKGLIVEEASLIGVDSLGMDVRVSLGMESRTLRFSFNARALSENAAEKKIRRMLFPRYQRKKLKNPQ